MLTARIGPKSWSIVHILEEHTHGYGMALCGASGTAVLVELAPTCDACQAIWSSRHPEESKQEEHGPKG
jgi:hypothetical protein